MGKLILLSGPSCIGKSPLTKAIRRLCPDITASWQPVVIYNSRHPRPGEQDGVDYHFRMWQQIEGMRRNPQIIVRQVRNDLQAIDLQAVWKKLQAGDVFFEGNVVIATELKKQATTWKAATTAVMVSPLSMDEINDLKRPEHNVDLPRLVKEIMQRKLLRRAHLQKMHLGLDDLRDIDKRASCAYDELKFAPLFDAVIPNHDGEDSDNWNAFGFPLGDARRATRLFLAFLLGKDAPGLEHWDEGLLP